MKTVEVEVLVPLKFKVEYNPVGTTLAKAIDSVMKIKGYDKDKYTLISTKVKS